MRRLVYFVATTVDGRIAAPDGGFDFFPMGDHLHAQAAEYPETLPAHARHMLGVGDDAKRFDTVVMGRQTYAAAYDHGVKDPYAPLETIVFSRTLPSSEGRVTVTSADPAQTVRALKSRTGGDIWLCGGGELADQLADEIDEFILKVNPVLVGDGVPLSRSAFTPRPLALRATRTFDSGVVWLTYEVVKEPVTNT